MARIGREPKNDSTTPEEPTDNLKQVARSSSRKLLTLLLGGALILFLLHISPIGEMVRNRERFTAILQQSGDMRAELYFVLVSSLMIMVGTPRLLFYTLGGFVFGFWEGLFLSLLSSLTGSFLTFHAARWGGKTWLMARFGHRQLFRKIIHTEPTVASVALIRMLPISNLVINAGLAVGPVENRAFLLGSLIGFLPQGVVVVIVASGIAADVPWAGALQIGTAGILLLFLYFWTIRRNRKDD